MLAVPTRRSLLKAGVGLLAAQALPLHGLFAEEPPRDVSLVNDFDELWGTLSRRYCFFAEKRTDWDGVRAFYRPQAQAATSTEAFGGLIDRVLRELYDAHTYRRGGAPSDPRGPYHDLWVEPASDAGALVTSVREGSAANDAGIDPGDLILSIDGEFVSKRAAAFRPRCLTRPDPAADSFALNIAVSGRRGEPRTMVVRSSSGVDRFVSVPLKPSPSLPDVESRTLPDGYGMIIIRSFADEAVVHAFDEALSTFKDVPGLIIDVRQNGGGDTAVARPIMGRFITEQKPYALMRRHEGEGLTDPWTEVVDPRGPFTYTAPVVVLTSRWSASMAEGFPMGMRGLGRATIVGTPMMRLGAAVFPLRLDRTGIELQYSAEPVYDVHDRPRWLLEPDIDIGPETDALAAGVTLLRSMTR